MCDRTRPFEGLSAASGVELARWLDEFFVCVDGLVSLREQSGVLASGVLVDATALDPLLGSLEVARFLGVKPRTVHQWSFRRRLPEGDLVVHSVTWWRRSTVLRWAGDTGRLSDPGLRAEYQARWGVEPARVRRGGRIPKPPEHGDQVMPTGAGLLLSQLAEGGVNGV